MSTQESVEKLAAFLKKGPAYFLLKREGSVTETVLAMATVACQEKGIATDHLEDALNHLLDAMASQKASLTPAELAKIAKTRVYAHREQLRKLPNGHPDNAWRSPESLTLHLWCELSMHYQVGYETLLRYAKHSWLTWAEEQKTKPQMDLIWDGETSQKQAIAKMAGFLKGCFKGDKAEQDRNIRAIVNWMWGVKRRNMGRTNPWPYVLTFMGKRNGTGKTKFVDNLVRPWGVLVDRKTVNQLVDERHQAATAQQAIVVLDELAGAGKADCNAFKRLITADHLNVRQLYASEVSEFRMYASFIATSNSEWISDFWTDPSGIRRWYPIQVNDFRGNVPEDFDAAELWKWINPDWASCFGETDTEAIEDHKQEEPIRDWLATEGVWLPSGPDAKQPEYAVQYWVSCRSLFRRYLQDTRSKISFKSFVMKMNSLVEKGQWKKSGRNIRGFGLWIIDNTELPNER